eukprot:Seg1083.1 transcript_id=Seg1083.1/GoldUCD/mRNA.D3Y31 product="Protein ZINC INDUCED FACILITATOR 1" protein_id=Seg1083.1/GoldUCD/D3Y31
MGCWKSVAKKVKGLFLAPGQTPLDPVILGIVALANVGNAMMITMPFSFLPKMMRELGVAEKEIGSYVGVVASSLYIGRAFGSYIWGWLCDKIGHKRSLLISMTLMLVATMFFGFSKSIAWAVTARLLQGFCGGCKVAIKAIVFALCDKTNKALGMAIVMSSHQIGLIIGPAVGGYLVLPAKSYPSTFSKGSLFDKFPFLLPILINSAILAISIVLTAIKVPETLISDAPNEKTTLVDSDQEQARPSKMQPSITESSESTYLEMYSYDACIERESYTVLSVRRKSGKEVLEEGIDGKQTISYFHLSDGNTFEKSTYHREARCCEGLKESSLWHLLRSKAVRISLFAYAIFSFVTVGLDETFPIFADSSRRYGGLAFTSAQIGTTLLLATLPVAFLIGPCVRLEHKFGIKKLFIISLYFLVFGLPLFPFIGMVPPRLVWYAVVPAFFSLRMNVVIGDLAVNVVLNNSVDPKYIGMVNGLGLTASCVVRAISPTVLGSLYSWSLKNEGSMHFPFNHAFPYVVTGFVALLTLFNAVYLPDKPKEINFVIEEDDSSSSNNNEDGESNTSSV